MAKNQEVEVVDAIGFPRSVRVPTGGGFFADQGMVPYEIDAVSLGYEPHYARYSPESGDGPSIFYNIAGGTWHQSAHEDCRFATVRFCERPVKAEPEPEPDVDTANEDDDVPI